MSSRRKKIRKYLLIAEVLLILLVPAVYLLDFWLGDGDGIIERFGFNPWKPFFAGQILVLPFLGMTSSRPQVVNGSLLVLTIALCLMLSDFLFDRLGRFDLQHSTRIENLGTDPIYTKYDTTYFKNYRPNYRFVTHLVEAGNRFAIANTINSLGIRGPEILPKQSGEQRLILLGDSFIQSHQVAFEETVGAQLDSLLGDTVSVVQHGNPSWSPLLELNWLVQQVETLEPDRVILFLYYNDFFPGRSVGDEGYTPFARFDEAGYPAGFEFDAAIVKQEKRSAWKQFWRQMGTRTLVRLVKLRRQGTRLRKSLPGDQVETVIQLPPDEFAKANSQMDLTHDFLEARPWGLLATLRDTSLWDRATRKRLALSGHYLRLAQSFLSQKGIHLTISLIPSPWQFSSENLGTKNFYGWDGVVLPRGGLEAYLQSFCEKQGISFLPLYPAFFEFKRNSRTPLYFYQDGHWTPAGHRLVAETIGWFLKTDVD